MNLTKPTFNLVAVARHPDDYDPMEGGGQMTTVHAICEKIEPNGVKGLFVLNAFNSRTVLNGDLNPRWRAEVEKAGIDPVHAIGFAQTLAETLSVIGDKLNTLPVIADVLEAHFPHHKMPSLREPSVSLHLA